jgi:hypothetical protein
MPARSVASSWMSNVEYIYMYIYFFSEPTHLLDCKAALIDQLQEHGVVELTFLDYLVRFVVCIDHEDHYVLTNPFLTFLFVRHTCHSSWRYIAASLIARSVECRSTWLVAGLVPFLISWLSDGLDLHTLRYACLSVVFVPWSARACRFKAHLNLRKRNSSNNIQPPITTYAQRAILRRLVKRMTTIEALILWFSSDSPIWSPVCVLVITRRAR